MSLCKRVIYVLQNSRKIDGEFITINTFSSKEHFEKYCAPYGVFVRFATDEDIKNKDIK